MNRDELNNQYFDWMCRLVCDERYSKLSHRKLLFYLHDRKFVSILLMDENREADGIELRYRFGREYGYSQRTIATCLDDHPCSILEMMIALAVRCEEHIMEDPDIGDRTGQWFWNMIVNLGLGTMTNRNFDEKYVDAVVDRFLNREYARNGEGGLFTVRNSQQDMRTIDIWYQMCAYINRVLQD